MRSLRFAFLLSSLGALGVGCYSPSVASPGFHCHPIDNPSCPDGQICNSMGLCVSSSSDGGNGGNGIVPKTGAYTGPTLDPGLAIDASKCPDVQIEPNDSMMQAVMGLNTLLMLQPDYPSPALGSSDPGKNLLAICPKGAKDLDYYQITTSAPTYVVVQLTYDIHYGDLDVGLFSSTGMLLASDGSAVTNACMAASLPAGTFFVGVGGANDVDVNRYTLRIRYYSTPQTCPTANTPVDMAM